MYFEKFLAESISSSLLASTTPLSLLLLSMQKGQPVRADANPILLIPGLGAGDSSMYWIRKHLEKSGHTVYGSELMRNEGSFAKQGPQMKALITRISKLTGKPVDIVGWSMGGRYALHLVESNEDEVGRIITLGSPIVRYDITPSLEIAWIIALSIANISIEDLQQELLNDNQLPGPRHPVSAITGAFDAVVNMRGSMIPKEVLRQGSHLENIQVRKGHIGLGVSTLVLSVILDRLVQPIHAWQPYAGLTAC